MYRRITLRNDFHHTSAAVLAKDGVISAASMRRAERKLCGMSDCTCGGLRGEQGVEIEQVNDKGDFKVVPDVG